MVIFLKYAFLFILGLSVSVFIYPFFHESGHALALMLFGEEILSIELFPLPNVMCKISDMTNGMEFLIIGFAGELLPFVISFIIRGKGFWVWYFRLSLRIICLISFLISLISMLFYKTTTAFQQDDVITIISTFPQYTGMCAIILILLISVTILLIINDVKQFNTQKIYLKF